MARLPIRPVKEKRPARGEALDLEMLSPGESKTILRYIGILVNWPAGKMRDSVNSHRTICYIDGFNLYYGLRHGGMRHCYWLDVRQMAVHLVRQPHRLVGTKYFTARVSGAHPGDSVDKAMEREASRGRQQIFLEALDTLRTVEVFEGHYLLKRDYCRKCKADYHRAEEKMTDVRIATELLTDAFLNRFDSAVVVSGDSDLSPPISMIRRHFPNKNVVVAFPPNRYSAELASVAHSHVRIWEKTLERSQLPDEVKKRDGTCLKRPTQWH